jgi:anaerobic ribonucleoside-triphosphate reductase activating protein
MTKVRIASIVENSVVDGEGKRTVVYFQGCSLACKGCQNFAIWNRAGGHELEVEELAYTLGHMSREHHNYTIQGGEPTEQAEALDELMAEIRHLDPKAHITVYTGYTWEELPAPVYHSFCSFADVVVDGRFDYQQDDPFILWRGSRNQRPIDIKATLEAGKVVTLDWEKPRLIIDFETGEVSMPVGMFEAFGDMGEQEHTRRCGDFRA